MFKQHLTGAGMSALLSQVTVGTVTDAQTATGTSSQANSFAIADHITRFSTTAANSGARLPSTLTAGDELWIMNGGASTLLVYPPVGGTVNGAAANATLVNGIPTLKAGHFKCIDGLNWYAIVGA